MNIYIKRIESEIKNNQNDFSKIIITIIFVELIFGEKKKKKRPRKIK